MTQVWNGIEEEHLEIKTIDGTFKIPKIFLEKVSIAHPINGMSCIKITKDDSSINLNVSEDEANKILIILQKSNENKDIEKYAKLARKIRDSFIDEAKQKKTFEEIALRLEAIIEILKAIEKIK